MRVRALLTTLVVLVLASCATGSGGAPTMGYTLPSPPGVSYSVGDTVSISLQGLGQPMEINARSAATYDLAYTSASENVSVTATVARLAADVSMPMTDPVGMDESALEGGFVFELDGRGRAVSMSSPEVSAMGGQVFAAPLVAHTLFPRLPDRIVGSGDSWVDSVTYREVNEAGETEIRSSLTYTVVGESQADGRSLLDAEFQGTAGLTQDLNLEGARITQDSEVEVTGRLRWDARAGLLYESEMVMEGPGSVRVAILPAALPTRVRWLTRVRLQEE